MLQIQIINGPNLNLLGKREREIYGDESFESYFEELRRSFPKIALHYYQSNHEGDIIDKLHEIGFSYDGIIINPGALSHYSYAVADAIAAIETSVVEVHISDISKREEFRKISVTERNCDKMIVGKGLPGYREALEFLLKI